MDIVQSRRRLAPTGQRDTTLRGEWMAEILTHAEAVEAVSQLFRERGPVLGRRMRRDFEAFLSDRSIEALASCLARNGVVEDEAGFAEWRDNPRHKRSDLICLSAAGKKCFRKVRQQDAVLVEALFAEIPERQLVTTRKTLKLLNNRLNEGGLK